jgi:translation initiation factor 2 beta subunit (eIF-2beta)/eIF-5
MKYTSKYVICKGCDEKFDFNSSDGAHIEVFGMCRECNDLDQRMKRELLVSMYDKEPFMKMLIKLNNKFYS